MSNIELEIVIGEIGVSMSTVEVKTDDWEKDYIQCYF